MTAYSFVAKAPDHAPAYVPQIRLYQNWLAQARGRHFQNYHELWQWSVTDLDAF